MTSAQPDAPRFSIITIGRNDLAGLKVAAQSIASQTCQDLEWIVSDGASTDGSVEWLESANLAYLDFISEPDNGIQDAYNKGIARATGEILVFINSGDMFASDETLALVDQDQKMRGWLWAYGAMNVVDSERNVIDVNNWRNFSTWQLRMGLHSIGHQSAFSPTPWYQKSVFIDPRWACNPIRTLCCGPLTWPNLLTLMQFLPSLKPAASPLGLHPMLSFAKLK